MKSNKDPKEFASFLNCLSMLENNVFLLYQTLARKVQLPLAKSLLLILSSDSQKHSVILKGVGDGIAAVKVKTKECENKIGEVWRANEAFYREIAAKEKITEEELPQLAEKLAMFEGVLGEEYYVFVQMQTLDFMTKEINQIYSISIDSIRSIFESIIKDEERHREILGTIRELFAEKVQKPSNLAPMVKFQHPDSWIIPSNPKE